MLRRDLSTAELRICWYLLTQVMNTTGNCCCSNQHLANALGLTPSTVVRAKANLKQKHILDWPHLGKLAASAHLACTYNFTNRIGRASTHLASDAPTQLALAAKTHLALDAPTHLASKKKPQTPGLHAGRSKPEQAEPQLTAETRQAIGNGFQQLASHLRDVAAAPTHRSSDAEQFAKWKAEYRANKHH